MESSDSNGDRLARVQLGIRPLSSRVNYYQDFLELFNNNLYGQQRSGVCQKRADFSANKRPERSVKFYRRTESGLLPKQWTGLQCGQEWRIEWRVELSQKILLWPEQSWQIKDSGQSGWFQFPLNVVVNCKHFNRFRKTSKLEENARIQNSPFVGCCIRHKKWKQCDHRLCRSQLSSAWPNRGAGNWFLRCAQ